VGFSRNFGRPFGNAGAGFLSIRELLDWLARRFSWKHGWSQKHLIRTIVTSATLFSNLRRCLRDSWKSDPHNVWLARGAEASRADAEVVRDIALSVSGLITHKLGGPSVIPPRAAENVLDVNFSYPKYWKPAEGPER